MIFVLLVIKYYNLFCVIKLNIFLNHLFKLNLKSIYIDYNKYLDLVSFPKKFVM